MSDGEKKSYDMKMVTAAKKKMSNQREYCLEIKILSKSIRADDMHFKKMLKVSILKISNNM